MAEQDDKRKFEYNTKIYPQLRSNFPRLAVQAMGFTPKSPHKVSRSLTHPQVGSTIEHNAFFDRSFER
jgi:hypothetical protein